MDIYHIVRRPLVTEKGTHQSKQAYPQTRSRPGRGGAYSFEVHPDSNKVEIRGRSGRCVPSPLRAGARESASVLPQARPPLPAPLGHASPALRASLVLPRLPRYEAPNGRLDRGLRIAPSRIRLVDFASGGQATVDFRLIFAILGVLRRIPLGSHPTTARDLRVHPRFR